MINLEILNLKMNFIVEIMSLKIKEAYLKKKNLAQLLLKMKQEKKHVSLI